MNREEVLKYIIEEGKRVDYSHRREVAHAIIHTHIIELEPKEGLEMIRGALCTHLALSQDMMSSLISEYKQLKGISLDEEFDAEENYQKEILKELKQTQTYKKISPAQDFTNGQMYYTFFNNDIPYMINSQGNIYKFNNLEQCGIKLRNTEITRSGFSVTGVLAYKEGKIANPKECLEKIIEHIKKFVILQDHKQYTFLGIWTMGTYMYRLFRYYPYIWINADKGSGKTKVMEIISPISFNGMICTNQTQATITRGVDADGSTLFIDEFENMNKDLQQGVITILNSGFSVASGKTTRSNMNPSSNFKQQHLEYYSPKVFAGINDISDVLQDRCIKLRMLKKNKSETVQRYKVDDELEQFLSDLRDELYICTLQNASEIRHIYNSGEIKFPEQLSDRGRDIWECIFTIARFIDKRGNTMYEDEMKRLAIQGSKERARDNIEKNPSYKLLNELYGIIASTVPIIMDNGKSYYCSDTIFNLLRNQEGLDWIRSKRHLTMELKNKFQIETRRKTIGSKKITTYKIVEGHLDDLLERYNISDGEETSGLIA